LIEACGDGFSALNKIGEHEWFTSHTEVGTSDVFSNPTEAAARLWLALNKK
jgi:hypothetical protein